MNSLKYHNIEIPLYITLLHVWIKIKGKNTFNSNEMIKFLEDETKASNQQIIQILDGKAPGKFSRSSKTNINYLTIFNNKNNTIPKECFNLLNNADLLYKNKKFFLEFDSEENLNFFIKWKNIFAINKFIYYSDKGPIKTVIAEALQKKFIWEMDTENKTNPHMINISGTVSGATKQYGFYNSFNDLITLINSVNYIDFYDIYDPKIGFLDEESCIMKIENKINQNKIIEEMTNKNIKANKLILESKIKELFFKKE